MGGTVTSLLVYCSIRLGPLLHPCLCYRNHWPADTHPLGLKYVLSKCSRNYYQQPTAGRINHWQVSRLTPPAVPDVLLLCEHFMARHILCFHITDKFVLSLSHWPLSDNLNDVVQLEELALLQVTSEGEGALESGSAQTLGTSVALANTHM